MHVLTVELVYWSIKGDFNYLLKNSSYKERRCMCFSNKKHYVSPLKTKKPKPKQNNEDLQNAFVKQESACYLWSHVNFE